MWSEVLQRRMMWRGCIDKKLWWWCVRLWDEIRMVHRSMRNGSRVADETVYKESVVGVGGFPFLLSLLVLLYSKASYDFEIASTLVLSWSPRNEYWTSCLVFWYHIIVTSITYVRPCQLQKAWKRLFWNRITYQNSCRYGQVNYLNKSALSYSIFLTKHTKRIRCPRRKWTQYE